MPDKRYNFNGSAAYDYRSNAVQQPRPAVLPEEKPAVKAKRAPKAKLTVAPVALVGMLVTAVLLIMMVYIYVQLYEATDRVGALEKELSVAQANTTKLRSTYESRIDLAQIEAKARELGMSQPSAKQSVYLNISGADHAEVLEVDNRNFLEKAWDALVESFRGILEYLS